MAFDAATGAAEIDNFADRRPILSPEEHALQRNVDDVAVHYFTAGTFEVATGGGGISPITTQPGDFRNPGVHIDGQDHSLVAGAWPRCRRN